VLDASVARKRRVEKLSLKTFGSCPPSKVISSGHLPPAVPLKKRKLSAADPEAHSVSTSKVSDSKLRILKSAVDILSAKRDGIPKQIRYDPEIPMTKAEASAWRREQRRLRNRESAAASRQKTRERITELEIELSEWKSKFADLEKKYSVLLKNQQLGLVVQEPKDHVRYPTMISPLVSPQVPTPVIPLNVPSLTSSVSEYHDENHELVHGKDNKVQHLIETISRLA